MALERAKEAVALSDEYGLELWLAFANIDLGWAESELGSVTTGVERMLAKHGRLNETFAAATEAVALAERTGQGYSICELLNIKAGLAQSTNHVHGELLA